MQEFFLKYNNMHRQKQGGKQGTVRRLLQQIKYNKK